MKFIYTLILLFSISFLQGQEICNNGIDDDGDMLVDLNDPDCECPPSIPSGLIPNPSFEDFLCCPTGETQLNCAVAWEQASQATSDYFSFCGNFITHPVMNYPAPLPIPDGQGWVGFRDGKPGAPNFKEYVGACLNDVMEVGIDYKLDFFLGFPSDPSSNEIVMTIYGTTDCDNLPFGGGDSNFGCPTNGPGWTKIAEKILTGSGEWKNVIFEWEADQPYTGIVLGPGCDLNPEWPNDPYYFVDRLSLARSTEFGVPFAEIQGSLCEENLTLVSETDVEYTYQWYRDGIAIDGETNAELSLDVILENAGVYVCLVTNPDGCFITESFEFEVPVLGSDEFATICEGESFSVGSNIVTTEGFHTFVLTSSIGCDSTVNLELTIEEDVLTNLQEEICEGQSFTIGAIDFSTTGFHSVNLTSSDGCDSLVELDLNVIEALRTELSPRICEGTTYEIAGQQLSTPDTYTFMLSASDGCDSIVTINLEIKPRSENTLSVQVCEGVPYLFDGDLLFDEGEYEYTLIAANGCDSLLTIDLEVLSDLRTEIETSICEGESFELGNATISSPGIWTTTINSSFGCDSTIEVSLSIDPHTESEVQGLICEGEEYTIGENSFSQSGFYTAKIPNAAGCDSTISLELDVLNYEDGVLLPNDTLIKLGDVIDVNPNYINPAFTSFTWNNGSEVISTETSLPDFQPLSDVTLVLVARDENDCPDQDTVRVRVDRDIGIYHPNIFSPNNDNLNELFTITTNLAVSTLDKLIIYDRWGNLVYSEQGVPKLIEEQVGWNGNFNGTPVEQGVYVFYAELTTLDNQLEMIKGDITVVR